MAVSCGTSAAWQPTISAWNNASCDVQIANWWKKVNTTNPAPFDNELARSFGEELTAFDCSIGTDSTCDVPGCFPYASQQQPVWPYLGLVATVHVSEWFDLLYNGVEAGQLDYVNMIPQLEIDFFPPKTSKYPLGNAQYWVSAALMSLASCVPLMGEELYAANGIIMDIRTAELIANSFANFGSAGIQQAASLLAPQPSQIVTAGQLMNYSNTYSDAARRSLVSWSNTTMAGKPDLNGKTILDYMQGGAFVSSIVLPNASVVGDFYKTQMLAHTIASRWKFAQTFTTFFHTNNPNDTSGPIETRYYSPTAGGVFYTYQLAKSKHHGLYLDKPIGLDILQSRYGIDPSAATKSAAEAFLIAGLNWTDSVSQQQFEASLSSNTTLSPWLEGPAFPGVFPIPVCDMGTHNWNSQYGGKNGTLLPCCCGPDCRDTKAFVNASNLHGNEAFKQACKKQLKGTGIKFKSIDYGFR